MCALSDHPTFIALHIADIFSHQRVARHFRHQGRGHYNGLIQVEHEVFVHARLRRVGLPLAAALEFGIVASR